MTRKQIAMHMHAYRRRAGLKQVRFARLVGISQAAVSKYERGLADPSALVFLRAQKLAEQRGRP